MRRMIFGILALAVLLGALAGVAFATEAAGATFSREVMYKTEIENLPLTVAATVRFDAQETGRSIILGNYTDENTPCFNFEVNEKGHPRLYMIGENGMVHDYVFKEVSVYTGEKTQIMIAVDAQADTATCYIDGAVAQQLSIGNVMPVTFDRASAVGGDLRSGNAQYFKGELFGVWYHDETVTPEAITAMYDLSGRPGEVALEGYPALKLEEKEIWLPDYKGAEDYAYSFAVLGDIQSLTCFYPDKLHYIYDWLVENVEEKKIKHVFGLGDNTDDDTVAEWELFLSQIEKLEGLVPYSIVRGNHDSMANFRKFITREAFGHTISGGFDEETMVNTYQLLEVGQVKYLIINLDIGPSDQVLQWVDELCRQYSDRNVIITTHIYQYSDGTTLDSTDPMPALKYGGVNTGDTMWEKCFKKHENISLILSGHIPVEQMVVTKTQGEHGNTVTQMLIDPQTTDKTYEGVGLVTMLYFSEDGKQVDVEYYSTIKQAHYIPENQFHMELDTVEILAEEPAQFPWYFIVAAVAIVTIAAVILVKKKK